MLIGLHGRAGCGKDTVADYLIGITSRSSKKIAFADPLYDGINAMFGWDRTELNSNRELKEGIDPVLKISPRVALQTMGHTFRELSPGFWLRVLESRYQRLKNNCSLVVVTDIRYDDEADLIRGLGGFVWHISRADTAKVADHPSEKGIRYLKGDVRIDNDRDLEALYRRALYWYTEAIIADSRGGED